MRSIAWYVANHNRFLTLGISRLFSLARTAYQKKTDREIRGRSTCHIFPLRRARPSSIECSISRRIPSFYRPYRLRLFFLTRWFKGSYFSTMSQDDRQPTTRLSRQKLFPDERIARANKILFDICNIYLS